LDTLDAEGRRERVPIDGYSNPVARLPCESRFWQTVVTRWPVARPAWTCLPSVLASSLWRKSSASAPVITSAGGMAARTRSVTSL